MKSEDSEFAPAVDFTQFKNIRGQAHSKQIERVLLNDGKWYDIIPGSFHLYKTQDSVPFAQFDVQSETAKIRRIEVFPATVAGWAYDVAEDK